MQKTMRVLISLFAMVAAQSGPVEKVIELIGDLKTKVEEQGEKEATTYEKFSCFCKENTASKSEAITESQDTIDTASADIAKKSATKEDKEAEKLTEKKNEEMSRRKIQGLTEVHQKNKNIFNANDADLGKALGAARRALQALQAAGGSPKSLLDVGGKSDITDSLDLAEALDLVQADKHQAVSTFLQRVDPNDPQYKFHAHKITEIIEELVGDIKGKQDAAREEWRLTVASFQGEQSAGEEAIETATGAIATLTEDVSQLSGEIAQRKVDLINAETSLKDDTKYLHELVGRCTKKAQDYDEKTKARAEETEAVQTALDALENTVADADEVNNRPSLLAKKPPAPTKKIAVSPPGEANKPAQVAVVSSLDAAEANYKAAMAKAKSIKDEVAVTPEVKPKSQKGASLLEAGFLAKVNRVQFSSGKAGTKQFLQQESIRLNSKMLSALAIEIEANPFAKVKNLVNQLVQRLMLEATQETSKKGFCDLEIEKSQKKRDAKLAEISKLDAQLSTVEAKKGVLTIGLDGASANIEALGSALEENSETRGEEKMDNAEVLQTAKEGVKAVDVALTVLRGLDKSGAKAASLVQVHEDHAQRLSPAILLLLERIKSDFEKTIKTTEASEKENQVAFAAMDIAAKNDITSKNTMNTLEGQDLKSVDDAVAQGFTDLKISQNLVDAELKNIEELQPGCLDTGMSYNDRVAKRDEEIAALTRAVDMLKEDA